MQRPNWTRLSRAPDLTIGSADDPQTRRWWILPRNARLNLYLHKFLRSDADVPHDHPYWNVSLILRGYYIESVLHPDRRVTRHIRRAGRLVFRGATLAHRVELVSRRPVWTLFLTGPRVRAWGFHCPKGWVPHDDFLTEYNDGAGNVVSKGCAE